MLTSKSMPAVLSGTGKLDRRYGNDRAHLVLQTPNRIIQPAEKETVYRSGQSMAMFLTGANSGKLALEFSFDVSPDELKVPVVVILIDGDGNRGIQKLADLANIPYLRTSSSALLRDRKSAGKQKWKVSLRSSCWAGSRAEVFPDI